MEPGTGGEPPVQRPGGRTELEYLRTGRKARSEGGGRHAPCSLSFPPHLSTAAMSPTLGALGTRCCVSRLLRVRPPPNPGFQLPAPPSSVLFPSVLPCSLSPPNVGNCTQGATKEEL